MPSQQRPWGLAFGLFALAAWAVLATAVVVKWDDLKKSGLFGAGGKERPAAPAYAITAQELFNQFEADPRRAARKYKGLTLEVSGRVARTGADGRGRFLILAVQGPLPGLESFEETWERIARASARGVEGVRCYGDASALAGQEVTLTGRCEGMPRDVVLSGCRLTHQ
jgi:hypothetical protein